MFRLLRHVPALALGFACALTVAADAAEKPLKAFTAHWTGRPVALKRTLYSMVYDERGHLGITYRGRSEGLVVATPSDAYFRFDGRQSEEDIVGRDPNRVMDLVRTRYHRAMHLDIGTVAKVSPVMLMRYEPGVKLVVDRVLVERERVRLVLHKKTPEEDLGFATALTVQWPVPLSRNLDERALIEAVIYRFVEPLP